jgi:hypothetical protein
MSAHAASNCEECCETFVLGFRSSSVFPSLSTPEDVVGLAGRRRIVRGAGDTERD